MASIDLPDSKHQDKFQKETESFLLISFMKPYFGKRILFYIFEKIHRKLKAMKTKHFLGLCTLLCGLLIGSSCIVQRTGPKSPSHKVEHPHKKKKHHKKHKAKTPPPPQQHW